MKFGDFLFPESRTPETDYQVITEALQETELAEQLGYHSVWLGEHHFDGVCSYADPIAFAGAVVARTKSVHIGFSAVQTAFHHPVRLAEQIALLDNLSGGRIIVGTARGSAFNRYEYRGYGVSYDDARQKLAETEEILIKAWTGEGYHHKGRQWELQIPPLRPKPLQKPHPPLVRAIASEKSLIQMAQQGRPVMMSLQSVDVIRRMFQLYRDTMSNAGYDHHAVERSLSNCWVWFNAMVADTNAEAAQIGRAAYATSMKHVADARIRMNTSAEQAEVEAILQNAAGEPEEDLIHGSPDKLSEKVAALKAAGVSSLMIQFRIGDMPWHTAQNSMRLFAEKVMPQFQEA